MLRPLSLSGESIIQGRKSPEEDDKQHSGLEVKPSLG